MFCKKRSTILYLQCENNVEPFNDQIIRKEIHNVHYISRLRTGLCKLK